jgi:hypothetical protein
VIQDVGRNTGVVYNINNLDETPKAGANLKATDEKGRGTSQKGEIVTGASW